MMKVLFITNIPSPYRVEFFNELGKYCSLTVWFEAENESNRSWNVEKSKMNFSYEFLKGITIGLDKHVNWSIIKALRASRFDIYVLGCYSSPTEMAAIQWLRSHRIPFLLNSDGGFIARERDWKHRIKKYFISSATGWLSSGQQCTKYLTHYGADPAFVYEYPFASLSYSEKERSPMRPERLESFKRQERLKSKVILSIGQFISRKGFAELLKASPQLDDGQTSLVIVGGGPLKDEYKKIIKDMELDHVVLKDFMSREQLIEFYRAADLFVLPTHQDVWGLVINEAISFGLPVVTTTGAGAAYDLVDDGRNGFVVDVRNMNEFVRKCQYLLDNDAARAEFGAVSQSISCRYTIKQMASRHMERFASFLEEPTVSGDAARIG
ncbi:glycosyltransferase family 4 protein [Cohnella herbarum]|uniref:Glycosyltransferase family 4 protein n=1 Tax=Cohnella herbarum TaxID=2728023 RepID=A0A7Z2VPP3_9BACL|nr:glycosyltransferase family 4 protein [Cohnella herbarum]QJD87183.1 glycosyltransferase family 4 protein [Cohnella herbarum]